MPIHKLPSPPRVEKRRKHPLLKAQSFSSDFGSEFPQRLLANRRMGVTAMNVYSGSDLSVRSTPMVPSTPMVSEGIRPRAHERVANELTRCYSLPPGEATAASTPDNSIYSAFDIVGPTEQARYPWQRDIGIQCNIWAADGAPEPVKGVHPVDKTESKGIQCTLITPHVITHDGHYGGGRPTVLHDNFVEIMTASGGRIVRPILTHSYNHSVPSSADSQVDRVFDYRHIDIPDTPPGRGYIHLDTPPGKAGFHHIDTPPGHSTIQALDTPPGRNTFQHLDTPPGRPGFLESFQHVESHMHTSRMMRTISLSEKEVSITNIDERKDR